MRIPITAVCFAGLIVGSALSGCAPQGDEDPMPTPSATRTVVTKAAVPLPKLPHRTVRWPAPAVSVEDNTIRLGEQEFDVSPLRADAAVSTRGGVYFLNAGELWYLDELGAVGTGYARVSRVVVSADGRYLGLVDRNHGPVGPQQVQVATAVVYDTTTGRAVMHSRAGMRGGPGHDDLDLRTVYAQDPPAVIGFEGDELLASTPAGVYAYPVSGGDPHPRSGPARTPTLRRRPKSPLYGTRVPAGERTRAPLG